MENYSDKDLMGGSTRTPRVPYTGETQAVVVAINPDLATLAKYGINYNEEPARTYTSEKTGLEYSMLKYLLEISTPSGVMYETYTLSMSDRPARTETGKIQVIDDSLQSAYIREITDKNATLADMLDAEIKALSVDTPDSYYVTKLKEINKDTVRIACEGEVKFYEELFEMSRIRRNGQQFTNEKGEKVTFKLTGFHLGDSAANATAEFKKLVAGDITELEKILKSTSFTESNGNPIPIGVLVGLTDSGRKDSNGNPIYYTELCNRRVSCSIFRPATKPKTFTVTFPDGSSVSLVNSRLSRNLVKDIYNAKYPWTAIFKTGPLSVYVPKTVENEISSLGEDDDIPF